MATTYKKKLSWKRWSGRPAELASVAQEIKDEVEGWLDDAKAGTDSQELKTWPDKADIDITIVLKNITTESDDPKALANLPARDLASLKSIWFICHAAKIGAVVSMRVDRDTPAMTIEIKGSDRTRVEGLTARVDEVLRSGARRPSWYERQHWQVVVYPLGMVLLFFALSVVPDGPAKQEERVELAEIAAISIALLAASTIGFVLHWITPDLELLSPGERTRWQRFGKAFGGILLALVVGIAATAIWDAVK